MHPEHLSTGTGRPWLAELIQLKIGTQLNFVSILQGHQGQ